LQGQALQCKPTRRGAKRDAYMHGRQIDPDTGICGYWIGCDEKALNDGRYHPTDAGPDHQHRAENNA